jgi:hypothetical protein
VESEWTNPLNAIQAISKSLLCCNISLIGLHSDWIGTYNLMLKLVSENVKAWFWQALNPHPLYYSLDKPISQCSSQLSHVPGISWLY